MKKTLKEELKRIHGLTYGSEISSTIVESIFSEEKKDEKKADTVDPDVEGFFGNLQDAINGGGLSQQKVGSIEYVKGVESMQIGLQILGYELPRYGVDGLFGPETARAVRKFNKDNEILKESIEYNAIGLIGKPGQGTHNASDWQSRNAWDVKMSVGDSVKSLTNGTVSKVIKGSGGMKKVGVKKIYGDQITVKSSDGPDVFYTHIETNLTAGSSVSIGDEIGKIMTLPGMPSHVHIGLSSGNLSDYISDLPTATGGSEGSEGNEMLKATPEMLEKLVLLLQSKDLQASDIKQYTNLGIDTEGLVDKNFYEKLLENLGAPVSDENLKFLYAWRQAEGKAGKYNPFNTTQGMPGATKFNSVGVRNYKSLEDGMVATIKTLKNGRYECIVNGLKNDIGAENIASCSSLKTWGTGSLVAKVISGYNRGASPKIGSLA
jgi:hypothetical protein